MTKAEIEAQIRQSHGNLSRREAQTLVDLVLELIKRSLINGTPVQIKGFGQFGVRHNAARVGRNLQTGQAVAISPRRSVIFRPSQQLKKLVQDGSAADSR